MDDYFFRAIVLFQDDEEFARAMQYNFFGYLPKTVRDDIREKLLDEIEGVFLGRFAHI